MLQFSHHIEVPETVNPIQISLESDHSGLATIISSPSGMLHQDDIVLVPDGKAIFYCEHSGPGNWTISAFSNDESTYMHVSIVAIPKEENE